MKRFFASMAVFVALLSGSLLFAAAPSAQAYSAKDLFGGACQGEAANSPACVDAKEDETKASNSIYGKDGILTKIVNILGIIIGIAAVIMIIVGGLKYILSDGDSAKISNAKSTIMYAIIGLVIAVAAPLIIRFVVGGIFS